MAKYRLNSRGYKVLAITAAIIFLLALSCSCSDGRKDAPSGPAASDLAGDAPMDQGLAENVSCGDGTAAAADTAEKVESIIYYTKKMAYATVFNDINDSHMQAARAYGLPTPPEDRESIEKNRRGLVKVIDNANFMVQELTHSVPYLTPAAAGELGSIAKAFRDSLDSKGFPAYRLKVSSILRTNADVRRLCRTNGNATDNSAHRYGTTFDITYTDYDKVEEGGPVMEPYELTKVLAEVLCTRQQAGRCYIKYEKKQHVFHITVRRK